MLIPDWRSAWKWISVQFMSLAAVVAVFPAEYALMLISYVPDPMLHIIPGKNAIVLTCLVIALIGRFVKQKKPDG